MKIRFKMITVVALINFALLMALTISLPDTVPNHVNSSNVIDGMGTKWYVPLMGAITALLPAFIGGYKKITGEKSNVAKSENAEAMIFMVITLVLIGLSWMTYSISASGLKMGDKMSLPMDLVIGIPIGVLFVYLGNYMGVIKKNFYLGIRTPWTLMDETVWKKTHRMGGYTFTLGGIIIIISILAARLTGAVWLYTAGILFAVFAAAIVPAIYSFVLYTKIQKEKNK